MLRLDIVDSHNETSENDFLVESKKPGTYAEKIALDTLTALNCDSTKGKFRNFNNICYIYIYDFYFHRIL